MNALALLSHFFAASVGALLLVAAILKAGSPDEAGSLIGVAHTPLIAFEVTLGAWLLTGFARRAARRVAMATFGAFALFAARQLSIGAPSCGCFGRVQVAPSITFTLDTVVVAVLLLCDIGEAKAQSRRRLGEGAFGAIGAFWGMIVIATAWWSIAREPYRDFDARQWVGRYAYVLDDVDSERDLTKGQWTLVFVASGCPRCDRFLETLDAQQERWPQCIALIEVSSAERPNRGRGRCVQGHMRASSRWLVRTPQACVVRDGIVVGEAPVFVGE